jgi:hypothetical protein
MRLGSAGQQLKFKWIAVFLVSAVPLKRRVPVANARRVRGALSGLNTLTSINPPPITRHSFTSSITPNTHKIPSEISIVFICSFLYMTITVMIKSFQASIYHRAPLLSAVSV